MLRLHVNSKLSPKEVMEKAIGYFGPGGNEMEIKERGDDFVYFEGGGGGVEVTVEPEGSGAGVEFVTREWEYQVKDFATIIKK